MRQLNMELYTIQLKTRYLRGNRKVKKQILDEFCQTSGYDRKSAIRLFNRGLAGSRPKPGGKPKQYDPLELAEPLKRIWLAANQLCGKRLKSAMPLWLPHYGSMYGVLDEKIHKQLLSASAATLDRLLKPFRLQYKKRFGGTKPGTLLKHQIPIKTDQWNESTPGFVEADTVAHCGTSLIGNFVWSITLTDIYSGWTENRAAWNKGAHGILEQIAAIESSLPFALLGFDCDNGSEFLNYHLMAYFQERKKPLQFTRSRPYHKGDNAHVEQKNWTHVRQLFGYQRFSNPEVTSLMNDLYQNECSLLHNYFYPSMKLIDKQRIQSKIKKCFDAPKTPYQRLLGSEHISFLQKEKLKQTFQSLNPFQLEISLKKKLNRIFRIIGLNLKKTGTEG